ncbi:hypothetical protein NE237_022280 [Protea cynaroides]|uniref:Protein kinase domain-containing protein n=1 Tax=Protea cynaroides TaxID=273540 RepID=A0A9Q0K420_9MAGN|nr:hypothetical protein NE237_022280 [Protea cynaroides]
MVKLDRVLGIIPFGFICLHLSAFFFFSKCQRDDASLGKTMSSRSRNLWLWWRFTALFLLLVRSLGLSTDGILLLSFKYSVLSDPLSVLATWNYDDDTPCSWNGVMCTGIGTAGTGDALRVISLALPNNQLLGLIPPDLGMIEHLRHLDLSNNSLNGTLPPSLFNASELQSLALSNNVISGSLPETFGGGVQYLNLSDNALAGKIPDNLTALRNLTVLSLSSNYFSGSLPSGFQALEVLDLSFNLINGSLPADFGGDKLQYFNLSNNRLSGAIPPDFAKGIPANATLDLSFNNLTGEIPESGAFLDQNSDSFAGNPGLCGKPLKQPCSIPSSISTPPNASGATAPPAIAVIPKTINSTPATGSASDATKGTHGTQQQGQSGLRPGAIVGIVVGDLAGIGILSMIFLYVYQLKKKGKVSSTGAGEKKAVGKEGEEDWSTSTDSKGMVWSCLGKKGINNEGTSETAGSERDEDEEEQVSYDQQQQKGGSLVTMDGEAKLELETLLKASAYILGATGSSIVYKAVLEDGTTLAVRRIGEGGLAKVKDFENQVRFIAKLRHPNLVHIRGFYWSFDEKLVVYDYVSNGSLANAFYRKPGSSPYQLPWEVRLKIARGVGRGLAYLHEKKQVHGNLKPSNILLGVDMEPRIGDFGLERLIWGEDNSYKAGGSGRHFGSKRSTTSRDSVQEQQLPTGTRPSTSSMASAAPYMAPESLKNLKPNPKWDVYSFGVILLELLTGKMISERELGQWNTGSVAIEDSDRVLRMADVAIRVDVECKAEAVVACFKLGFGCTSMLPQKRPSMKEALQALDKLPSTSHHHLPY